MSKESPVCLTRAVRMLHPGICAALAGALLIFSGWAACGRDEGPAANTPVTTSAAASGEVLVLAAASLADALDEIAPMFEAKTGIKVRFSYGGSDSLAGQIKSGAPADAVIFAGAGPLDGLQSAGLTLVEGRRDIAANRLVVIARAGSGAKLASLGDFAAQSSGMLAIADPQLAPAGRYARAALQAAGVWEGVVPRLIPGLDVRNAAAAVTAGNARFGLVYETDAAAVKGVEVAHVVPTEYYPRIVYPAAVVASSRNQKPAKTFLEHLGAADAQAVFSKHGFRPAP